MMMKTGFIWLKMGTSGELCNYGKELSNTMKFLD
jgi:hypothetical protein